MNQVHSKLKRFLKNYSFVRLPSKKSVLTIRPAVSGKGYATFYKYGLSLKRALCRLNFKDLKLVSKYFDVKDFYFETKLD